MPQLSTLIGELSIETVIPYILRMSTAEIFVSGGTNNSGEPSSSSSTNNNNNNNGNAGGREQQSKSATTTNGICETIKSTTKFEPLEIN